MLYFSDEVAERLALCLATTKVRHSRFEFAAAALGHDQAGPFDRPAGFPMGLVHFTPVGGAGRPILSGTTVFRPDRFVFELGNSS